MLLKGYVPNLTLLEQATMTYATGGGASSAECSVIHTVAGVRKVNVESARQCSWYNTRGLLDERMHLATVLLDRQKATSLACFEPDTGRHEAPGSLVPQQS